MTRNNLIPPSPTSDEYRQTDTPMPATQPIASDNPYGLFEAWLSEARASEISDPNAMALSTVDGQGMPDVRMVLLKDLDPEGFVFYTNLESAKGQQLATNPKAALCFHWKSLRRQVRVRGHIMPVSEAEADAYFATRARDSRIGAWASAQSRPLEDAFALEKKVAAYALKFGVGEVPRPDFWSGFRLVPLRIEFWRDKMFRLHDRTVFERTDAKADWSIVKLYP